MILLTMSNCDFQNLTKIWGFVGDGKKSTMNMIYVCEDIKINEKHIFSDIKCSLQCPKWKHLSRGSAVEVIANIAWEQSERDSLQMNEIHKNKYKTLTAK